MATTNALELGVDIAGAGCGVVGRISRDRHVVLAAGRRSGRRGQSALIVLIARDDPLDTYLVHHPAALLDKPIERVVIDPATRMSLARSCFARQPSFL